MTPQAISVPTPLIEPTTITPGKICIVGTSCAGKTTLATSLAKRLGMPFVAEVARTLERGERDSLSIQSYLNEIQIHLECEYGPAIYDGGVITNIAYTTYFGKEDEERALEIAYDAMEHCINRPYDYIIFVDEYFPLEDDGNRDMDVHRQWFVYQCLRELMKTGVFNKISTVIWVKGTNAERVEEVIARIYGRHYYE